MYSNEKFQLFAMSNNDAFQQPAMSVNDVFQQSSCPVKMGMSDAIPMPGPSVSPLHSVQTILADLHLNKSSKAYKKAWQDFRNFGNFEDRPVEAHFIRYFDHLFKEKQLKSSSMFFPCSTTPINSTFVRSFRMFTPESQSSSRAIILVICARFSKSVSLL